jgi:hypothetical protein
MDVPALPKDSHEWSTFRLRKDSTKFTNGPKHGGWRKSRLLPTGPPGSSTPARCAHHPQAHRPAFRR